MPRPNKGPKLAWLPKRGCYYVKWYSMGRERLKSTGTADKEEAQRRWRDFLARRPDLHPQEKVFDLPEEALQAPGREPDTIYFIGGEVGAIKIGVAIDPEVRRRQFQRGSPITLKILATAPGDRDDERNYHHQFRATRLHGEWFERTPELLAEIERLNRQDQGEAA